MKIKRPVIRYHGGKFLLARWIISHFPPHRIYVEPFGGAASVLMQKPRSYAEVYNDVWDSVVNVFEVLRDPNLANELKLLLKLTPYSKKEFENSHIKTTSKVENARKFIFRSFSGFSSASANEFHATGFRANSNRSGNNPAHDWMNYPKNIDSFVERLRGVIIENKHYKDVISQHDSVNTLFYIDPPYLHETRKKVGAYQYEMTDKDHVSLSELLHKVDGMVIISGYNSKLYNHLYGGWDKVERIANADGAQKRIECLWISPKCSKVMKLF